MGLHTFPKHLICPQSPKPVQQEFLYPQACGWHSTPFHHFLAAATRFLKSTLLIKRINSVVKSFASIDHCPMLVILVTHMSVLVGGNKGYQFAWVHASCFFLDICCIPQMICFIFDISPIMPRMFWPIVGMGAIPNVVTCQFCKNIQFFKASIGSHCLVVTWLIVPVNTKSPGFFSVDTSKNSLQKGENSVVHFWKNPLCFILLWYSVVTGMPESWNRTVLPSSLTTNICPELAKAPNILRIIPPKIQWPSVNHFFDLPSMAWIFCLFLC